MIQRIISTDDTFNLEKIYGHQISEWINRAEPRFTASNRIILMAIIPRIVINNIKNLLNTCKLSDDIPDAVFMLLMSKQRNWSKECAICLENHMGKICNCGHKEITMFKPCGHTICSSPCFTELYKSSGFKALEFMRFEQDSEIREILGTYDTNTNGGFNCPLCRTPVTKTFSTENIRIPFNFIDPDKLVNDVITEFTNQTSITDLFS
jgi:hypothetical protein